MDTLTAGRERREEDEYRALVCAVIIVALRKTLSHAYYFKPLTVNSQFMVLSVIPHCTIDGIGSIACVGPSVWPLGIADLQSGGDGNEVWGRACLLSSGSL